MWSWHTRIVSKFELPDGSPTLASTSRLRWPLAPRSREILLVAMSALGFFVASRALLEHGVMTAGGYGGADVFAYWTAGRHLLDGHDLYGVQPGGYAAFLYPPPIAQLFIVTAPLPFPVVVWLWRGVELVCLRLIVGSWRASGIALLLWPPIISELDAGNVHLIPGAAVALLIRGDGRWVLPAVFAKFASLGAIPAALATDRRRLLIGGAIAALVSGISFLSAPGLWLSYLAFLPTATQPASGWFNLGYWFPTWLRLALAGVFAVLACRWIRLSAVAVTLSFPVLWFHSLSTLVAVATATPAKTEAPTRSASRAMIAQAGPSPNPVPPPQRA
jgi:hypothetical protein